MQHDRPTAPVIEIRLVDPYTMSIRPLPDDIAVHLRSVSLEAEVGLAKAITATFDAWNVERGDWVIADETVLWPGVEFELWSGDDTSDHCHGLFRIHSNEPDCPSDGLPSVSIRAMDGLARFVDPLESFVFEATTSLMPALLRVAENAGMELDADPILAKIPLGDIAKEAGKSDLEWLKEVAMSFGLGMPHVRYEPSADGRTFGTETLVMQRLNVSTLVGSTTSPRFKPDQGMWLRYLAPDPSGGELASFRPAFDLAGVPVGVEVIGMDWQQHPPKVMRVTVKVTPLGPVVESEEQLSVAELKEATSQLRKWNTFSRQKIENGDEVVMSLLGDGGSGIETGLSYRGKTTKKTIKEKRWAREVLYSQSDVTSAGLREYALNIMRARLDGFWTCDGALQSNIGGANRIDIDQVHYVDGVPPAHQGYYIFTQVNHSWSPDGGLDVSFHGQKLIVEKGQ